VPIQSLGENTCSLRPALKARLSKNEKVYNHLLMSSAFWARIRPETFLKIGPNPACISPVRPKTLRRNTVLFLI